MKHHNLLSNPRAVLHLEDAAAATIVEGTCSIVKPSQEFAEGLAAASAEKDGYGPAPSVYLGGVWQLVPTRVLAWTDLPTDATRFVFP